MKIFAKNEQLSFHRLRAQLVVWLFCILCFACFFRAPFFLLEFELCNNEWFVCKTLVETEIEIPFSKKKISCTQRRIHFVGDVSIHLSYADKALVEHLFFSPHLGDRNKLVYSQSRNTKHILCETREEKGLSRISHWAVLYFFIMLWARLKERTPNTKQEQT